MELKIKIEITDKDTDEVLFTDWASGDSLSQRGMFESAEMMLGKMERHLPDIIEKKQAEDDAIVGVGDEPQNDETGN